MVHQLQQSYNSMKHHVPQKQITKKKKEEENAASPSNLQHNKAATAALLKFLIDDKTDIVLIQEPWINRGRVSGLGEVKGKIIYDKTAGNVRTCIIEPSLSDHRYICMEISNAENPVGMYRDPRKTNWEKYSETSNKSNKSMSRKNKKQHGYRDNLEKLREETRCLFNKAKKTGEWEQYNTSLTKYNKEIRKARRNSWRKLSEEVETTSEMARLQKILAKDPINPTGNILKPNGKYTETGRETLETLLQTHLPDSSEIKENTKIPDLQNSYNRARKRDWSLAKKVVTLSKISWAIDSFEPYKSPGPDVLN
ncbi:hypothetical protein NQ318_008426 [Aromia moschata]|uniref:Endonuclease/exonuclease/phosphatase domain-containing protein n=1 Tax=Aromia moschata TaxID=1265417 RepID=A0AAV8YAU0_9CUCU|nr:hypothetical protein NQ318_008426 [Aromia moschata]